MRARHRKLTPPNCGCGCTTSALGYASRLFQVALLGLWPDPSAHPGVVNQVQPRVCIRPRWTYARATAAQPYQPHLKKRKPRRKVAPTMDSQHPAAAPSLPPESELTSATPVPAIDDPEPAPASGPGGAREGGGRKRMPKKRVRSHPAFVSLSVDEKRQLKREAKAAGLTISYYIRKKLKLPIEIPARLKRL